MEEFFGFRSNNTSTARRCATSYFSMRLRVDLHRCADLGVTHQLLHHLHIVTGRSQQCAIGPLEGVPADLLLNTDPPRCRLQNLRPQAVRPERSLAEVVIAGEDPVVRLRIAADRMPNLQLLKDDIVEKGTGCSEISVLQGPMAPSEKERRTSASQVSKWMSCHFNPSASPIRIPVVAQIMPMSRSLSGARRATPGTPRQSGHRRNRFELTRTIITGFRSSQPQRMP
jgi:hypothetical protein